MFPFHYMEVNYEFTSIRIQENDDKILMPMWTLII